MCTQETSIPFRKVHTSIVKQIEPIDSVESGCISDEDNNHQNSSILSSNTDISKQPIRACSQDDIRAINICCNNDNLSSENLNQSSTLYCSRTRRDDQYISHKPFYLPSSNSDRKRTVQPQRSHSFDTLLFPPLHETTTNDSGTGGSITYLPTEIPRELPPLELAPVFGKADGVLLSNRYEFDPTKVVEYMNRKRHNQGPVFGTVGTPPIPPTTSKSSKRNSTGSKKSPNLISRLLKPFKPPTTNQPSLMPMIRHHSSHDLSDENH